MTACLLSQQFSDVTSQNHVILNGGNYVIESLCYSIPLVYNGTAGGTANLFLSSAVLGKFWQASFEFGSTGYIYYNFQSAPIIFPDGLSLPSLDTITLGTSLSSTLGPFVYMMNIYGQNLSL